VKSKKFDVIVVGELNVDIILNGIESFPEIGKEKLAGDMAVTLGSSSAIFAGNLSSLGVKVGFIGKTGDDNFGKLITDSLLQKGVNADLIIKDKNSNTGATIILNYDEDRAMITYQGAMNKLTIDDIPLDIFEKAKHLHFSSYYLQLGIKKDVMKLFRSAKDAGLTTSFDMQWDPDERWELNYEEVLPYVDVFLPNEQELLLLTKENSLENAIKKITPFVKHLVVKMGSKGSLLIYNGENIFKESYINKNVIDAIGAGDSFNAGFIFKFIKGAEITECQVFGNLMGAINTTAAGGTKAFTNYDEILKIAKERFGYSN
jgi:sugar/nucleoside kinase (ribokinase family)